MRWWADWSVLCTRFEYWRFLFWDQHFEFEHTIKWQIGTILQKQTGFWHFEMFKILFPLFHGTADGDTFFPSPKMTWNWGQQQHKTERTRLGGTTVLSFRCVRNLIILLGFVISLRDIARISRSWARGNKSRWIPLFWISVQGVPILICEKTMKIIIIIILRH